MRERPIPFSADMVKAILAGRKTQTRRVVTEFKDMDLHHANSAIYPARDDGWIWWYPDASGLSEFTKRQYQHGVMCRYGQPGAGLWVRENWKLVNWDWEDSYQKIMYCDESKWVNACVDDSQQGQFDDWLMREYERVVAHPSSKQVTDDESEFGTRWDVNENALPWRPSLFMPRWASRITLEITGVRVERLQAISEADAIAEGYPNPHKAERPAMWFRRLWDSINAGRGYGWSVNPWVWVIEFQQVKP